MSTKKRDLAQELVDFLIKEDGQKKNPLSGKSESIKPTAPEAVRLVEDDDTRRVNSSDEQKTIALVEESTVIPVKDNSPQPEAIEIDVDGPAFEFSAPIPEHSQSGRPRLKILSGASFEEAAAAEQFEELGIEIKAEPKVEVQPNLRPDFRPEVRVVDIKASPNTSAPQGFGSQRANIVFNDVSALMAGTEAVKVAQARITTLEKDNDSLRNETEQLLGASETLQRRLNELRAQHETLERKHREKVEILEDEKAVLRTRLNAKEGELGKVKKDNEDLKARFQTDLRKIRVRERELEHRQEIMKAEMATVVHSKDEVIIELKRQLEKLSFELDNFRAKSADMNARITEFYDRNHRTVKALRLALSVLETGDSDDKPKKANG